MPKQHVVVLSAEQRAECRAIVARGVASALRHRRARILLAADAGAAGRRLTDAAVAERVGMTTRSVARVRRTCCQQGFAVALRGQPRRRSVAPKLDSAGEARLIALACSPPPDGRARWSLRLLANRVLLVEGMPPISRELVRTTLKKTNSSPGWYSNG